MSALQWPPSDLVITIGCILSTLARPGLSMEEADKSREDPGCQASKDKEAQVESGPKCEGRILSQQDSIESVSV